MEISEVKQALRQDMASRKKEYSKTRLSEFSEMIISNLEQTELFRAATCIALYHAIPGEVQTAAFIRKWYQEKQLLLPLIVGNDLRMLLYTGPDSLIPGPFGILEPSADCKELPLENIDLIIVPGVAFDRQLNRMGRGKGYYDRLLSSINAPKIGICFDFQLVATVPVEPFDQKLDLIITEKEIIK